MRISNFIFGCFIPNQYDLLFLINGVYYCVN
jgi:hypothetical protein